MIPNQFGDNDRQGQSETGDPRVGTDSLLVSYCVTRAERARRVRDGLHAQRWAEYTRLWRGFWSSSDKQFNSERSKLISPALSQSIEMTVSEIEEAMFGREAWLDLDDDIRDEDKEDATIIRDQLLEDMELARVQDAMSKTFLMGAIYGTGISKIHLDLVEDQRLTSRGVVFIDEKVIVPLEAIRPDEFFIDPAAKTIEDALFCGHDMVRPMHTVKEQMSGETPRYRKVSLSPYAGTKGNTDGVGKTAYADSADESVLVTEFYGKIPAQYLDGGTEADGIVEGIVTLANNSTVLRAIKNPFVMQDRPVVAYQHDTVPGEFWGRGVAEKGYNPQKALDAELRARADSLALITAPMMGADMTRLGRNPDLRVSPGKIFMTRGRPSEVLEPVGFDPRGLALTFQQSGDLERMVQMATGAMDSATPLGTNRRNETATGMSMLQASFLKRAKRTMQNIDRQYMQPLIRKMLWRYMQYDPDRYPTDYKFKVKAAMGIMAKEVENSQLVSMLGFTPPESPAHAIILKALFDNTTSSEKKELKQAIDAMLAPPSPEQQQMQQMMQQLAIAKEQAEVARLEAQAALAQAQALLAQTQAQFVDDEVEIKAANAAIQAESVRVAREGYEVRRQVANSKPKPSAKKKK